MPAYHYQCANCYCTLHLDPSPKDGVYYSVVNGELCWGCENEHQQMEEDDDDD